MKDWLWRMFLGNPGTGGGHVAALDGLRGMAVLIVIGSHLSNTGWLSFLDLSGIGKSGVYLFFVLSAYLLAGALLARGLPSVADARYWANYALRRVLRIWPLYLVVLLLSWGLTCMGVVDWHYRIDTAAFWRHVTLREGISVLWSIPVEFTFYLWLPLVTVTLLTLRRVTGGRWLGLALLVLLAAWASWRWPAVAAPNNGVKLGPYLIVFLCGVAAAWMRAVWPGLGRWRVAWRAMAWVLLAGWVLSVPSVWACVSGSYDPGFNHHWFGAFGLGWAGLVLAVLWGTGMPGRLFTCIPLRLLGVVSFSAYLWHMPVLQAAEALGLQAWGVWGVVAILVTVLLVAMTSFLLFERPWRNVRCARRPAAEG